jgi:MFS family permease
MDCSAYVYIAEIWPSHLRSHGATFGLGSFFLAAIAYSSPSALAFSTIGYRYYFVFVSVCFVAATVILLYLPEVSFPVSQRVANLAELVTRLPA